MAWGALSKGYFDTNGGGTVAILGALVDVVMFSLEHFCVFL